MPGTEFETINVGFDQSLRTGTYFGIEAEQLSSDGDRTVGMLTNANPFLLAPDSPSSTRQTLEFRERSVSAYAAQLLGVRRVLEAESAALAALSIDEAGLDSLAEALARADSALHPTGTDVEAFLDADTDFHCQIADLTGNPALAALIGNLIGRTERARVVRAMSDHGAVRSTQAEHYAILAELRRHDPQRARIRMEAHLLGVEEFARAHPVEILSDATEAARASQ